MKTLSIRSAFSRMLGLHALLVSVTVGLAVWLAVQGEVHELLDDSLQSSSRVLAVLLADERTLTDPTLQMRLDKATDGIDESGRFAWQVVEYAGAGPAKVLAHSSAAPHEAYRATSTAGFFDAAGQWRVYASPLGHEGRVLYVAQTHAERTEAQTEIALNTGLAAVAMVLLALVWLRIVVRRELQPLQRLSARLAQHDPLDAKATLGAAEREELQPVHDAVDELTARLARRVAQERAFAAHAAHALRTPLAGMDAQLAVALKTSPPDLTERLQQVRQAAGRLSHVVTAILTLFRSGVGLKRQSVNLKELMRRIPVDGLSVRVAEGALLVNADPDLLAAALINLLDNAVRHGATELHVETPSEQLVRLSDNGPGVDALRWQDLRLALAGGTPATDIGLGLALADLVAKAHGGRVELPVANRGFVVELSLPLELPKTPHQDMKS
ncbi:sensor histidine kinase [Piscinibacterium candidicorallinum]|uniref:histidine kinase n=1 Tax=Piscinibacterium candidicorallinum TaxID=1793872 RepID=A0ABV7H5V6_9BURK